MRPKGLGIVVDYVIYVALLLVHPLSKFHLCLSFCGATVNRAFRCTGSGQGLGLVQTRLCKLTGVATACS